MDRVFVDTSGWFAFLDQADSAHPVVRDHLRHYEGRLVTSNFVFAETVTLCMRWLGHALAMKTGHILLDTGTVDLIRLTAEDEQAAWDLFSKRGDKKYSFTDCTTFALMRRLGLRRAVSLDADFRREGFEVVGVG